MDEPRTDNTSLTDFTHMLQAVGAHEPGHLAVITDTHIDHPFTDGTMCLALSRLTGGSGDVCYADVFHLRLSNQEERELPSSVRGITCDAATLEAVMDALGKVPEGSAVFIRQIHEIWVGRDDSPARILVSSWTGNASRVQGLAERATFTLGKVIPAFCKIARSRKLLLVSICSLPRKVWESLPGEIKNIGNLSYLAGKDDDSYSRLETTLLAGLADYQSGKRTLEDLMGELEHLAPNESSRRQAYAQALSCAGLHHAAWNEISQILPQLESFPVPILVRTAKIALDALDAKSCQRLISLARERGIATLQDWITALQLARMLGNQELEFQLLGEMAIHFPNHEIVLIGKLRAKVAVGDATGASKLANQLHRPEVATAMETIACGGSIPEVVRSTTNDDDRGLALMTMSIIAERNRNYSLAWEAARRVPHGAPQRTFVLGLRWRIWAKRTMERGEDSSAPGRPNHKDVTRLDELVIDTLALSREASIRHAMEGACHETLTPTVFQDACVMFLMAELKALRAEAEDKPWNLVIAAEGAQAEPHERAAFFAALKQPRTKRFMVLGQDELPFAAQRHATPEMARLLAHTVQSSASHETDEVTRLMLVEFVEMISRFLGDPSFDCMTGLLLVRTAALRQDGQTARNYAEEMLRAMPDTQPNHVSWRLGLAWMIIAESLLASGSARGALLPMMLAVKAMRGHIVDSMLVAECLNMVARMMRDLAETQKSAGLIALERELLEKHAQNFLLQRNGHFDYMLRLKSLSPAKPDEIEAFMYEVLAELRMLEPNNDRMPLLALVVNCVRFLRLAKREISGPLIAELTIILDECEKYGPSRGPALRSMLLGRFTASWFVNQLTKASHAVRSEDADAQFRSIQVVAPDGFAQAVEDNDPSLALAASAAVSQPALLCRQSAKATESDRAARQFREQLASNVPSMDESRVKDQLEALASRGTPRLVELDWTLISSVEKVQQFLSPDELLAVACILGDHSLGILKIWKDGVSPVTALPSDLWKEELWATLSPRIASSLSDEDVNQTLRDIRSSLWLDVPPEITHAFVVPETRLFGWPLSAGARSSGANGERLLGVSVAPSIAWLGHIRAQKRSSLGTLVFWIGHGTQDESLLSAKRNIPSLATSNGLTQISNFDHQSVGKASLALLVTHGEMTAGGELAGLSDETHNWDPEDVGFILAGCECVVLGCCSAGSSETPVNSNESWGLIPSILSHGVRCVVAPVWPISVGFLVRWLGEFLPASKGGNNIADAVAIANVRIAKDEREQFSMQVYGDGAVRRHS